VTFKTWSFLGKAVALSAFLSALAAHSQEPTLEHRQPPQTLTPALLPAAQAGVDPSTGLPAVTNELFNAQSGFFTALSQRLPGPTNPACAGCKLDLSFVSLNPKYSNVVPQPGSSPNVYGRMSWHSLEPAEGQYDFSIIDNVLEPCPASAPTAPCLPDGARFGFRVMALQPIIASNTNVTIGGDGYPVYSDAPDYLAKDSRGATHGWLMPVNPADATKGHYFVPDWNDPVFLDRIRALLDALGRRYNQDPRIGTLDIGLYGSFGEWHTGGFPEIVPAQVPYASLDPYYPLNVAAFLQNTGKVGAYQAGTVSSKKAIIAAHLHAFPDKQWVMLTDDGDGLCAALHANTKIPVGLRRDSLGSYAGWNYHFPVDPTSSCTSEEDQQLIAERWKIAPFVAEPYGNGSSSAFACQSFETDPTNGAFEITEQVPGFHLAAIKSAAFCSGTWPQLSSSEQAAVYSAGFAAGYRYAPAQIAVSQGAPQDFANGLTLKTSWVNTGVATTYERWLVEFSIWSLDRDSRRPRHAVQRFVSRLDLRRVLPTASQEHEDRFLLTDRVRPDRYELRLRVIDPEGHLRPMQLALEHTTPDGYYVLGNIELSGTRRH
jgi:hypothetical protein